MQTADTLTQTADTLTQTGTYVIDPVHSRVGFAARHAMVTMVRGSFDKFDGSGYFDIERPENSSVAVTIEAASIGTRHRERDAHLRSADFLDVAAHPAITFAATDVDQIGVRTYRVRGDLTIKGITKPVVVEAERTGWVIAPSGTHRVGFEGRTVINRKDWGIGWNKRLDAGGLLVSDDITIEFDISAVKSAATMSRGQN